LHSFNILKKLFDRKRLILQFYLIEGYIFSRLRYNIMIVNQFAVRHCCIWIYEYRICFRCTCCNAAIAIFSAIAQIYWYILILILSSSVICLWNERTTIPLILIVLYR